MNIKKVAVLQSNYLPWKGYFDLINDVDLCIFYDEVQFTKNDWRNRNKIKTEKGLKWISVPVGQSISRKVNEVEMVDSKWQRSHWDTIKQVYGSAAGFSMLEPFLKEVYLEKKWEKLSELNQTLIKRIAREFLSIETEFVDSTDFPSQGTGIEKLLDLLQSAKATHYFSGPAGLNYFNPKDFENRAIKLIIKDYEGYPEYPQDYPPFVHGVSIVDLLAHCGSDSKQFALKVI